MRLLKFPALLALLLILISGCASNSPLVGTWTGTVQAGQSSQPADMLSMATGMLGMFLNGPCKLTIAGDGKGFLKVASLPERPIVWSEEGGKLVLRADSSALSDNSGEKAQNNSIVGTLSEDGQTLTLDFGVANAQLKKEGAS